MRPKEPFNPGPKAITAKLRRALENLKAADEGASRQKCDGWTMGNIWHAIGYTEKALDDFERREAGLSRNWD